MKQVVHDVVPFLLKGGGGENDEEDGIIPEATKTIEDLLQIRKKNCSFQVELFAFQKFDGNEGVNCSS